MNKILILCIDGLDYKCLDMLGSNPVKFERLKCDIKGKNRHTIDISNSLFSGKQIKDNPINYHCKNIIEWYDKKPSMIWEICPNKFKIINIPVYMKPHPLGMHMQSDVSLGVDKDEDMVNHIRNTWSECTEFFNGITMVWINVLDAVAHRGEWRGYSIEEIYEKVGSILLNRLNFDFYDYWLIFSDHGNRVWLGEERRETFGHTEDAVIAGNLFDDMPSKTTELIDKLTKRLRIELIEYSKSDKGEHKKRMKGLGYL